jgi:hypothetical protein
LVPSDDVSANHIKLRVLLLDVLDHFDLVHAVALTAIQDDNVETSIYELLQADLVLWTSADGGRSDELLGVRELRSEREVQVLHQIGARKERNQVEISIYDR